MAVYANLAELRSDIADMLARPESDIASTFAKRIAVFETKFSKDSRIAEMETAVTLTVANSMVTLPDDFLELRNVVNSSNTEDDIGSYYLSGNTLVFGDGDNDSDDDDTPSQVTILYYARVPPLVNDSDTNWLLQAYPYIYFYGVMIEMSLWTADASALQVFAQMYQDAYTKIRSSDVGRRWSGAAVILSGPTP